MRALHAMLRAAVFMFALGFMLLFVIAGLSYGQGSPLPSVQNQFFGATGLAAPLGFVCTSVSGASTPLLSTFRDVALTTANQNPIRLNAAGRPSFSNAEVSVFLQAATYRITLHAAGTGSTCNGVTVGAVLRTADGISGPNIYTLEFATKLDDKVCHASQYAGATEDVKIVACIAVLPSTGGTIALSGLEGAQSWVSCPFTGVTKPITVIFAASTVSSAANCTVPVNVVLDMQSGGIISQAVSTTLTVNGSAVMSLGQHFAGSGAFVFGSRNPELYPQYWGALADGSTNDYTAFQASLDALETNGGRLLLTGNYAITSQRLEYSSAKSLEVVGFGWDRSKITWTAPSDTPASNQGVLNIHGSVGAHNQRVRVEGIFFEGGSNRAAGYTLYKQGINIYNSDNVTVRGNYVKGFRAESISLGNFGVTTEITDRGYKCWVENNTIYDFAQDGINPNMNQCIVRGNAIKQGLQGIEAGIPQLTVTENDIEEMTSYGIAISCIDNFVVSNNRFKNAASANQGFVGASIYIVGNGRTDPSKNGVISGNVILNETEHANQVGIASALGTSTTSSNAISISGNNINGSRICISPTALINSEIVNNTCKAGATSTYGIVLSEPSGNVTTGNIVRGNVIRGTWSSAALDDATPHANLNQFYWNDTGNSVAGLPVTMTLQQGIPVVITVANNTIIKLASTALSGILGFQAQSSTQACGFDIAGGNLAVVELWDSGGACGITAAASNYNVYPSGGEYKFQNVSGMSEVFKFQLITGIGEH